MLMFRDQEKPKRHRMSFLASTAAGAIAAYFLDPDRGRARRAKARDQIAAALRRGGRRVRRFSRKVGADAHGVTQRMRHQATEPKEYSDQTLAEKVKTELYGDPQVDRSKVLVNVENGVVFLRGRDARRRELCRRCSADQIRHPGWHQRLPRRFLLVSSQPGAQRQLLV